MILVIFSFSEFLKRSMYQHRMFFVITYFDKTIYPIRHSSPLKANPYFLTCSGAKPSATSSAS